MAVNVEYITLVQCTEKLCSGISQDPVKVTLKLFEIELVSEAQVTESLSEDKDNFRKATELVHDITRLIESFPERFDDFISVLNECPWLQDLVKHVLGKYEDIKTKTEAIPTGLDDRNSDTDDTIKMLTEANKCKMEAKFATLITNIAERLRQMEINFEEFLLHAAICFRKQRRNIDNASTIIEILEIISNVAAWKGFTCIAIEEICTRFGPNDMDLRKWISDFKIELAGFNASTKIINFMRCMKPKELSKEAVSEKSGESSPDVEILEYCHKLSVKLKADISVECMTYFDKLWKSIRTILLLQPLPVLLQDICKGCIEVTWLIRPITATEILDERDKFSEVSKEFNLVQVTLDDDYFLYRDYLAMDTTIFKKHRMHEMEMRSSGIGEPEAIMEFQQTPEVKPESPMEDALQRACYVFIDRLHSYASCTTDDSGYEIDYGKLLIEVTGNRRLIRAFISELEPPPPTDSIWTVIKGDKLEHIQDLANGIEMALQHHIISENCVFIVVLGEYHVSSIWNALMTGVCVEVWSWRRMSDTLTFRHQHFTVHILDDIILRCTKKKDDHSEHETKGEMQVASAAESKLANVKSTEPKVGELQHLKIEMPATVSSKPKQFWVGKALDLASWGWAMATGAERQHNFSSQILPTRCKYEEHCRDGAECSYSHTEYETKLFGRFPTYDMRYFKTELCNKVHETEEERKWCYYAHDDSDSWCLNCTEYGHLTEFCNRK